MPYEFGDVVLVRFPFTNLAAFKQRPACVVSSRAYSGRKRVRENSSDDIESHKDDLSLDLS